MQEKPVTRVNYFDRQFLRAEDFSAEQAYHLAMHRRHVLAQHTWGIVSGLRVKWEDKKLVVEPGAAIDGYGRELVLPRGVTLPEKEFDRKGSDALEVWLSYARSEAGSAARGSIQCKAEGALPSDRGQEDARVDLRVPSRQIVLEREDDLSARRQPPGVPEEDLNLNPARTPPDDPTVAWPVFLGRIRRSRTSPYTYTVDPQGRPYAGLIGEAIVHPAGHARVSLGGEGDDRDRFSVSIRDNANPDHRVRRLSLSDQGELSLVGDTTIYGDLTVDGGAIEFGAGPAYTEAREWRIYRVREVKAVEQPAKQSKGKATPAPNTPVDPGKTELRIEMAAPSGTGDPNQVVVGAWSEGEKSFKPCLTIDDQCVVTVHGNLAIDKSLLEVAPKAQTTQTPNPAAQAFLASTLTNAILTLSTGPRTALQVSPETPSPAPDSLGLLKLLVPLLKEASAEQIAQAIIAGLGVLGQFDAEKRKEVVKALCEKLCPVPDVGVVKPTDGGNGP